MNCKNCFTKVDMRSAVNCSTCNSTLHKECAIKENGKFYCDVCYTVKEEGETLQDANIQIPEVIRRSYIETYKACPYKFYNEVLKGIEAPPHIYNQMGIDLHELFKIASNDKNFTKDEMFKSFYRTWMGYDAKLFEVPWEVNKEKLYQRAIDSIDTFYSILATLPTPYSTEETIEFSIGDDLPRISTTSDRIDFCNTGELDMKDWKTGSVMVGQKLSSDLQAPLYIYGARQKHQMPVRSFTFYYLEENKQRVFNRINNEEYECVVNKRKYLINITDAIKEVQRMFTQIKKGNFNIPKDTKGMYFTCKMCHLKSMEICKGAEIESWKQYN